MDADSWSVRLSSASKGYQSAVQSRFDILLGFEEIDVDDDIREEFPCPFCSEHFDILGLCCHIDDEHPIEAKNGVCPVCVLRVGVDMVAYITLQHGNIFKMQRKRKSRKGLSHSTLSLLRREMREGNLQCSARGNLVKGGPIQHCKGGSHSTLSLMMREMKEGNLQSLSGGSSCAVSSTSTAPDPSLSLFILPVDKHIQSHSSAEKTSIKKSSNENVSKRNVLRSPPLSIKDKEEKERKCEFVQGLLLSTILIDK